MSTLFRVILAAAMTVVLTACSTAHAKAPATAPSLDMPPPPPHVVAPAPELPSVPEPVGELPPPATEPPPHASRPNPTKPSAAEAKPESKPEEPKPPETAPAEPPKEVPKTPEPAPQLVTSQTGDTSAAANAIRQTIDRAQALLNTVDYAHQSDDRKKAYNDAKLFLDQAEKALHDNNLNFGQSVATKAEKLANELAGR